jgi:hypothetical protein
MREINEYGADGWECFHIERTPAGLLGEYTAFLKREISG